MQRVQVCLAGAAQQDLRLRLTEWVGCLPAVALLGLVAARTLIANPDRLLGCARRHGETSAHHVDRQLTWTATSYSHQRIATDITSHRLQTLLQLPESWLVDSKQASRSSLTLRWLPGSWPENPNCPNAVLLLTSCSVLTIHNDRTQWSTSRHNVRCPPYWQVMLSRKTKNAKADPLYPNCNIELRAPAALATAEHLSTQRDKGAVVAFC